MRTENPVVSPERAQSPATMDVLEVATTSSNQNLNSSIHGNTNSSWGHQNRCYSNVSLASVAASDDNYSLAESFHTCYDDPADDPQPQEGNMNSMSASTRVLSFSCLEDVMEEDIVNVTLHPVPQGKNHHRLQSTTTKQQASGMLSHANLPGQNIVPLRSYSQLQHQPLSPRLTAARLALSSDIGLLRRPISDTTNSSSPVKVMAKDLIERDQMMASGAFPMSRSFATPRVAIGTAFRTSISGSSLSSLYTAKSKGDDYDEDVEAEQAIEEEEQVPMTMSTTQSLWMMEQSRNAVLASTAWSASSLYGKPQILQLEILAADVQLQILAFLPLQDVRSMMCTNRRYRRLLLTQDAQNLWKNWCSRHDWPQLIDKVECNKEVIIVDDLSLPTAARPSSAIMMMSGGMSTWHQQANLGLLLSMAQSQPTEIDRAQLNKYQSWRYANISSGSRRRRSRHRLFTTDGRDAPLLHYHHVQQVSGVDQWVVQFTGQVGQGDRCIRANQPLPRPTLIAKKEWMVPPSSPQSDYNHHRRSQSGRSGAALLDLFCRSARAVAPPRPAWRPFVAPFVTQEATVHLTPRFVSYYEVSIMEPTPSSTTGVQDGVVRQTAPRRNAKDCVAVGLATDTFDWHTRMPGWDAASFGYHGDDGGIFHSSGGMLREFGPSFGRGDVVGCGIDHVMRGIFYTLNGRFLGYGWTDLPLEILERDMYPVVGIDTNDYIHCNFGTEPFKYDLTAMVVRHEEFVHQSLSFSR